MDESKVMLSIKRRASLRVVGDPPNLGRVERIARIIRGRKKRKSRSGEKVSQWRGSRSRRRAGSAVRGWTMLVFSITILAIVATFAIWLNQRRHQNVVSEFEGFSKYRPVERVESRFESPTEEQSRAIVLGALGAKDEAAVLANFRLNGVAPAEVFEFIRREDEMYGPAYVDSWLGSIDTNNALVESLLVKRVKNGVSESRIAMLTPDEQGVWQLDFESFARKCDPAWEKFVSGEAGEGMVRVWLIEDNYFNGPFVDDEQWLCFSMARKDSDVMLFGYCRKNSPQGSAMVSIMNRQQTNDQNDTSAFRVTLDISRPEGAEKRQFEIKRVLAEDWLVTGTAFDGSPGPLK